MQTFHCPENIFCNAVDYHLDNCRLSENFQTWLRADVHDDPDFGTGTLAVRHLDGSLSFWDHVRFLARLDRGLKPTPGTEGSTVYAETDDDAITILNVAGFWFSDVDLD